jgi:hypothetical protein
MPSGREVEGVQINWPPVAVVVNVSMVWRLDDSPWRRMMVTGELVSFVAYVIACGWPSVTGFGTWVKVRTVDCAAANAANAPTRSV